eukprot:7043569-Pyramimonas_sp.AAC.1
MYNELTHSFDVRLASLAHMSPRILLTRAMGACVWRLSNFNRCERLQDRLLSKIPCNPHFA